MEKFIPYEKLSKKQKRALDAARRNGWGGLSPVTRRPANPKAYQRKKTRRGSEEDFPPRLLFFSLKERARCDTVKETTKHERRARMDRASELRAAYALERHPEGGWFAEDYTCPFVHEGRPLAGSIYFLLDGPELSHFHQIDCDELWYFHEGCGLKITVLQNGEVSRLLLGMAPGQRACALLPAGAIFAAENLEQSGYTFLSCATAPGFRYEGFRLIGREELGAIAPREAEKLAYLVLEE